MTARSMSGRPKWVPIRSRGSRSAWLVACCALGFAGSSVQAQCPVGACSSEAQCSDGKFCTSDVCLNPGPSGFCICAHNDDQCDDGIYCDGQNFCDTGTDSCAEGPPPTCNSPLICSNVFQGCVECETSAQCTTAPNLHCNASGVCVQCTSTVQCQDGSFCNGQETCDTGTGTCQNASPLSCSRVCFKGTAPGSTCTTDASCGAGGRCVGKCSELRLQCVQCDADSDCNNGLFCDGDEKCANDLCVAGTAPVCKKCAGGANQGDPCSTNAECPSSTCTSGVSYCKEAQVHQCVPCLTDANCDDLNYCTENKCLTFPNGSTSCTFSLNDQICEGPDGLFCNGVEICNHQIGNPCSLFRNDANCCFHGRCTPPKACTTNSQCVTTQGQTCISNTCQPPIGCDSNAQCQSGQTCTNNGLPVATYGASLCNDGFSCSDDSCNESLNRCDHVNNAAHCSDGNPCTGTETCAPHNIQANQTTGCVPGTSVDCSPLDAYCSVGQCNAVNGQCQSVAAPGSNGLNCPDSDPCHIYSACNNGTCQEVLPAANDPFRCTTLEFRPSSIAPVPIGTTVQLDLYAVASGCNNNPPDALPCRGTSVRVSSIDAILSWNKTRLELKPAAAGDPNPFSPCTGQNACLACSNPSSYPWFQAGWNQDCGTGQDGLNFPCSGTPANDGNAHFHADVPPLCADGTTLAPPACATPSGLYVATVKFRTIAGGNAVVSIPKCAGANTTTGVTTPLATGTTSNILRTIGPSITIPVTCQSHAGCNDQNPCTNDVCSCTTAGCAGTCSYTNNTNTCDDGLFCTANDHCVGGVCVSTAQTCSPTQICNEITDQCMNAECFSNSQCETGLCTTDVCVNNLCQHTPVACNDGIACTVDVCDPETGACVFTPNDAVCNTGLFCTAARCDAVEGCVFDHECINNGVPGNPCPDAATCDEGTDTCGGCLAATVAVRGPRYLRVTPGNQGATPIAIKVVGDCNDAQSVCVASYVQSKCDGGSNNGNNCSTDADCPKACSADSQNAGAACTTNSQCIFGTCVGKCEAGTLGPVPYYKTSAQWGAVNVRGAQIRPNKNYLVHTLCNFPPVTLSAASEARTWKWGDVTGDGIVDGIDIVTIVNAFKGIYGGGTTFEQVNIWPCTPDKLIDGLDIVSDIDAFRGIPFPCTTVCP